MCLIPIIILLSFEGLLRLFNYGDNFDLFIQNPVEGYEDYYIVNPEIGKKYFQKLEYTAPANDIFLKHKPDSVFRIFVMGSSTVYGFPYERNLMFSRILHERLKDTYPGKHIEVINTAITAINSYTLLDFVDEIIDNDPDALLIYAGHNEFYGAFGIGSNERMGKNRWLTQLHLKMMKSHLYQFQRNSIFNFTSKLASSKQNENRGTLMKRIVGNKDILLDSDDYKTAMDSYYNNISDLLSKTKSASIPVFISEVVSNLSDLEPFNSIETDNLESALSVYKKAQQASDSGNYTIAKELFIKAKDLDCIRFRASEEVNSIIQELAQEHEAFFVPTIGFFEKLSPYGIIGNNLMTEHVHPNINGNFLLAEVFFMNLVKSKIIAPDIKPSIKPLINFKSQWGYTELDSLIAHHRVELLKSYWPFVKERSGPDYKDLYKPKGFVDSLAFSAVKYSDINMVDVRMDLAKHYTSNKMFTKALKEYKSLVCINPNNANNLSDFAISAIRISDLPLAIKYFKKSLEFEENHFTFFKIGELLVIKGDYDSAIEYFERAYKLAPDNIRTKILMKTYVALIYCNRNDDANKIAKELKRTNPNIDFRIPQKKYIYTNYVPTPIVDEIKIAEKLWNNNLLDSALNVLEIANNIYSAPIINRYMGEIHLQNKELKKAYYYLNTVYDEFRFDPNFLNHLIILNLSKNDKTKAKKLLIELQKIDPDSNSIKKFDALLKSVN